MGSVPSAVLLQSLLLWGFNSWVEPGSWHAAGTCLMGCCSRGYAKHVERVFLSALGCSQVKQPVPRNQGLLQTLTLPML